MEKKYIIITGAPATGKTTYGKKIAKELGIPFFSKDELKVEIYNSFQKDMDYEEKRQIGISSYSVLWYVTKQMMETELPFILESNFAEKSSEILKGLEKTYGYTNIVIRFDTNLKVLHERFLTRENTTHRPEGLRANGVFDDFEEFAKIVQRSRNFNMNTNEIHIDTTDFSQVNEQEMIDQIKTKMNNSR